MSDALDLVSVVLPGGCDNLHLLMGAGGTRMGTSHFLLLPSAPQFEKQLMGGVCLVGWFLLVFSFYFPFFLPVQPPQETIPHLIAVVVVRSIHSWEVL